MTKIDFKKELAKFYNPKNLDWHEVDIPAMNFLMIGGEGNPNASAQYKVAVEALYGVAYPIKFMSKNELGRDYVVPPLEGLWYADDLSIFAAKNKDAYKWTMMLMQPDWITKGVVEVSIETAKKKNPDLPYDKLRFEKYSEGLSLQMLHIGSYDDEAPRLYDLHHKLMPEKNLDFAGHHHEIYLSDPRKTASERLKTILRQPVKAKEQ